MSYCGFAVCVCIFEMHQFHQQKKPITILFTRLFIFGYFGLSTHVMCVCVFSVNATMLRLMPHLHISYDACYSVVCVPFHMIHICVSITVHLAVTKLFQMKVRRDIVLWLFL